MKVVLLACLVLAFSAVSHSIRRFRHNPPPPKGPLKSSVYVSQALFTQKLDHFNDDGTTWAQRYFVNTEYFNTAANNVAFLMLGGEGDASEGWMYSGAWVASGQKYGAILFQLEHRYYGESQPFPDLSTENLRYLSSEQALADAANFIEAMNQQYSLASDVKWIVFGGSYSGSLAAWLRLKYPNLVVGASSASGPLLAQLDFPEYFQVVIDDLATSSSACVASLKTAFQQVDEILLNPGSGESLTNIFNLCEPIEQLDVNSNDVANFYNAIADIFAGVAQYNGLQGTNIDDLCNILTDEQGGTEINRLVNVVKLAYGSDGCLGYSYEADVEYLKNTAILGADRQWIYQTCTEYGWYQTTNREDGVFGRGCGIDLYTQLCAETFGSDFSESYVNSQIEKTNDYYGGLGIDVSNVVYVHGSVDPWHAVGLTQTTNPDSPVIYVEGTSHCANMYDSSSSDLPQLAAAKTEVDRLIGVWLGLN